MNAKGCSFSAILPARLPKLYLHFVMLLSTKGQTIKSPMHTPEQRASLARLDGVYG